MRESHQLRGQALACVCLTVAFALCGTFASAQTPLILPNTPESTSVLVGRAIQSGALQLPTSSQAYGMLPALTCSPVPCVLPNVQASAGVNIADEDPIASNPRNAS